MTNGEKYKTAEERNRAFGIFCDISNPDATGLACDGCPLESEYPKCSFKWLELEYDGEIKPCPFCGGDAVMNTSGKDYSYITCPKCDISTDLIPTDEAIKKWNRRVNNG